MNKNLFKIYEPNCGSRIKYSMLAIHGLAGSKNSGTIKYIANNLLRSDVVTIAIDLPGHGENNTMLTLDNCLNSIQSGIDFSKKRYGVPMYLYAASFGAFLSLQYVIRFGNPFRHMILRSPAVEMAKSMETTDRSLLSDGAKKIILSICDRFLQELKENDLFKSKDVPFPMTIIHGGSDPIVELTAVKRYIELKAPQAKLIVFENSRHNMRSASELSALFEIIGTIVNEV